MGVVGLPNGRWRSVHVIGPASAMNMNVDEPGRKKSITGIDDDIRQFARSAFGNADNSSAFAFDGALFENLLRKNDAASKSDPSLS